jgi:hypothetical protein
VSSFEFKFQNSLLYLLQQRNYPFCDVSLGYVPSRHHHAKSYVLIDSFSLRTQKIATPTTTSTTKPLMSHVGETTTPLFGQLW